LWCRSNSHTITLPTAATIESAAHLVGLMAAPKDAVIVQMVAILSSSLSSMSVHPLKINSAWVLIWLTVLIALLNLVVLLLLLVV